MFGAIVLRHVPKDEARIDLARHPIHGGFRGYSGVPIGLHYVSVKLVDHHVGFWCWVKVGEAVVRAFDEDKFVPDSAESTAEYTQLALSGAMGPALMSYPYQELGGWVGLVGHLDKKDFPPLLHEPVAGEGSRFDRVFLGTHEGNAQSFLAEFQYAFVRWLVSLDTPAADETALARWRHLVLSAYNAGEDRIRESGDLFPQLVDTLLHQLALLPDSWFESGSFLTQQAGYLAEDMIDTGVPGIAEKGQQFAAYLKSRQK